MLGVQAAQPLADLLTFAVSVPFFLAFLRELKTREAAAAPSSGPQ